jgi:hypothetical protein
VVEPEAGIIQGKPPSAEVIRATATRLLVEPTFKDTANCIDYALRTPDGTPKEVDVIEEFLRINAKS